MVRGFFIGNSPWVQITLAYGYSVQKPFVILDTGFTGDLQVSPNIAKELGLRITGITPIRVATGEIKYVPTAVAIISMEGINDYVQVLISEGFPLVGISFLVKFKYRVVIDYYGTVLLERI